MLRKKKIENETPKKITKVTVKTKAKAKKPTVAKQAKDMYELVDYVLGYLKDAVEKEEIDVYMNGYDIKTKDVDQSDDISPAEVATLGAYAMIGNLKKDFDNIKAGKHLSIDIVKRVEREKSNASIAEMFKGKKVIDVRDVKKLPKEVRVALKELLDKTEDE